MLISIICPVYNAEAYLNKCIDSIISQTYINWELILVDDGSSDNSGDICESYANSDTRIRVIHKKNEGVSAARQTGLDAANGEYVIHVDPDDWAEPRMLEDLYAKAKEDDFDMVICDFYRDDDMIATRVGQQPFSLEPSAVLKELFGHLHGSCWNKLVKKDCFIKYNVRFPANVNYCEDVCVNVQLLLHDIKIAYLPEAYYHYVQLPSSITNNFSRKTLDTCKKYIDFLTNYLAENSSELMYSKEMVKKNAVDAAILSNEEIQNLYPEIRNSNSTKIYDRIGYYLAFRGWQNCARQVFKMVKCFVKLRVIVKQHF